MLKKLTIFALFWTLALIMLGAWVRLHDSGLGCPDWPGCYGHVSPTHAQETIAAVESANPVGPVTMEKAWKEMIHRYAAGFLVLMVVGIMITTLLKRRQLAISPWLPIGLFGVILFQALLGMWTVTLLLKPAVVTGHLLGGLITLGLLLWLVLQLTWPNPQPHRGPRRWALLALVLVALQIVLGGWTSTNYAALACNEFPACVNGEWLPPMDFSNAFHVVRELGKTADGQNLSFAALTAIHVLHRIGAVIVLLVVGALSIRLIKQPVWRYWGWSLLAALTVQILLGISNVVFGLPLPVAVAHNGGAAVLLMLCIGLNYFLWQKASK